MTTATVTTEGPIRSTLIDIANCIGCRACQVACKQWNEKDGEKTELDDQLGFQNPAALSAKTFTLIAFHESENPDKPGGVESAFVMQRCLHCLEPACVSACPTTALYRQADGPVSYNDADCIGCRYCHAGLSLGRADCGMGLTRPEDLEVHALRRPRRSAAAGRVQRAGAVRRCGQAVRQHHGDSSLRQGVPRRRPALRHPGRDAGARAQAHRRPARQVRRPRLRREGTGRDERAVPVGRAVRETRLSDVRREALSGLHQDGARRRASRRDGRGRPARRRLRLLPEAGSGGGRQFGCGARPRPRRIRAAQGQAPDPVQLGSAAAHGVGCRLDGRALRPAGSAAAPTSPTPTRGACGSSSTWCGSRWPRARSRWPA